MSDYLTNGFGARFPDLDSGIAARTVGVPPTGALAQTVPRGVGSANVAHLSTGRLSLIGLWVPSGTTVTNISFLSGSTAATSPTNQWFGLADSGRVWLRLTANATTAAWAANTVKTLALTSPFVTTYTGLHYVGIMVAGSTVPTLSGVASTAQQNAIVPIAGGTSNTGMTTPPNTGTTANAITATANTPYAWLT